MYYICISLKIIKIYTVIWRYVTAMYCNNCNSIQNNAQCAVYTKTLILNICARSSDFQWLSNYKQHLTEKSSNRFKVIVIYMRRLDSGRGKMEICIRNFPPRPAHSVDNSCFTYFISDRFCLMTIIHNHSWQQKGGQGMRTLESLISKYLNICMKPNVY